MPPRATTDQNWRANHILQDSAQHQAVLVGQDQIENDQIGLVPLNFAARRGACGCYGQLVTGWLEHVSQHRGQGRDIVHQKDPGGVVGASVATS